MTRVLPLVLLFVFASVAVEAQSDSSVSGPSWYFTVHSGTLLAKRGYGTSTTASVMQGVRYKRFSLGAGVGYDAYSDWRTLPLFAGASYDLAAAKKHSFFLQMNTGYSKAWNPLVEGAQMEYAEGGGFFHHPFLGYKVKHGKISIHFTAGYKFQRLAWTWRYSSSKTTVQRDIGRMSVQMAIAFE